MGVTWNEYWKMPNKYISSPVMTVFIHFNENKTMSHQHLSISEAGNGFYFTNFDSELLLQEKKNKIYLIIQKLVSLPSKF